MPGAEGLPVVLAIGSFDYGGGFRQGGRLLNGYGGEFPREFELSPGDLMMVMTCQTEGGEILGVSGVIPDDGRRYLHNQRIGRLQFLDAEISPSYLFQVTRWPPFNAQLVVTATGSKILHTAPKYIEAVRLPMPPLAEQRAIAEVLGALDDKIAANTDLIQRNDGLASLTFKALLRDDVARDVQLSSLARFVNGGAYTKGASGSGRVVVRISELNSGIGASTVHSDREVGADQQAQAGDLLFAWSGSLTVHRWFRDDAIINQHIFKVIPDQGAPMWLVNQALRAKLEDFKSTAADKATTMGHIQRHHLDELVRVPASGTVENVDGTMAGLWDRALAAEKENLILAATRDALLPALMSGRLTVRDAEKVAESVT